MTDTLFLELEDGLGLHPDYLHETDSEGAPKPHPEAGQPAPLCAEGLSYAVPAMVLNPATGSQELGSELRSTEILPSEQPVSDQAVLDPDKPNVAVDARIIPGSRQIETVNPALANLLEQGGYKRVEPPTSSAKTRAKSSTAASDITSQEG